ncbi:hypothetical protein ACJJTC_008536 [Scirpophaga incertulas]
MTPLVFIAVLSVLASQASGMRVHRAIVLQPMDYGGVQEVPMFRRWPEDGTCPPWQIKVDGVWNSTSFCSIESKVKVYLVFDSAMDRNGWILWIRYQVSASTANVEHSTTGVSPAMLLQRRSLRSRLDMLRGERQVEDNVYGAQAKQIKYAIGVPRELAVGDVVSTRDFVRGRKWMSGRVQDKIGSRNYVVSVEDGPPVKRHIDQIRGGIRS